jgi:hypothetical protein
VIALVRVGHLELLKITFRWDEILEKEQTHCKVNAGFLVYQSQWPFLLLLWWVLCARENQNCVGKRGKNSIATNQVSLLVVQVLVSAGALQVAY